MVTPDALSEGNRPGHFRGAGRLGCAARARSRPGVPGRGFRVIDSEANSASVKAEWACEHKRSFKWVSQLSGL